MNALVISRRGMTQEAVTKLLVAYGAAGLDVVRLKGGDPFVFGRGGGEALALAEAGVGFDDRARHLVDRVRARVRPSSPSRTAASPTGSRLQAATEPTAASRTTLAPPAAGGTLFVLFMGLERAGPAPRRSRPCRPARRRHPPRWSAKGTLPDQESVSGCLRDLAGLAATLASPAPGVIVLYNCGRGADHVDRRRGLPGREPDVFSERITPAAHVGQPRWDAPWVFLGWSPSPWRRCRPTAASSFWAMEFRRIHVLPPYVFTIIDALKLSPGAPART